MDTPKSGEPRAATSVRVLFVGDSDDDTILLLQEMRRGGLIPSHARIDTPEAMRVALVRCPWDVVIVDLTAARLGTERALEILAQLGLDVPVIVISSATGEEAAVRAIRAGARDFLVRDDLERLVPAIRRELREAAARKAARRHERSRSLAGRGRAPLAAAGRSIDDSADRTREMESIVTLAGGIAHDFNNILTALIGHAELARREEGLPQPVLEHLGAIRTQAHRAANLTRHLLAYSRRQVLELRDVDLNEVVRGVEIQLRRLIPADVALEVRCDPKLPLAQVDPAQIERVVLHLCQNALDAMPEGGRLLVETHSVVLGVEFCRAQPWAEPGDWVEISVTDTGVGIPEADLERIFEPFFTTKGLANSSGLGLSMVHGVVKQHEGLVNVRSRAGAGSTFEVFFCAKRPAPAARPVDEGGGDSASILLLETDEMVRSLMARSLEAAGYTVLVARGPADALGIAVAHLPALAVLDIATPAFDGRYLHELLKQRCRGLRVLFTTGFNRDGSAERLAIEFGHGFLEKPFTPATLVNRVREALGITRVESPGAGR